MKTPRLRDTALSELVGNPAQVGRQHERGLCAAHDLLLVDGARRGAAAAHQPRLLGVWVGERHLLHLGARFQDGCSAGGSFRNRCRLKISFVLCHYLDFSLEIYKKQQTPSA
jgi:hypothetical protein